MNDEEEKFLYKPLENLDVEKPADDDITRAVGSWGRWQTYTLVVLCVFNAIGFPHAMEFQFFVPEAEHWCAPPNHMSNWSVEQWKGFGLPPGEEDDDKVSECHMYDLDYSNISNHPHMINKENATKVNCKYGWQYDRSQFTNTIENEWDLVCEKEFWAKTAASTFNAGFLVGVAVTGQLSDIFGRLATIRMCSVISAVGGFLTCVAPSFEVFCLTRFFVAFGTLGAFTSGYVMLMEITKTSNRNAVAMTMSTSGGVGYVFLTLLAYYVPDWRWLNLLMSIPLLLIIPFMWFLPESVKWLISQKRYKEAYVIMHRAAKTNRREFPSYDEFSFPEEQESPSSKKHTIWDLFRYGNLRKKTLILYFSWFVISYVYYGISLGANSLGGSVYINSFISGAVEVPSALLCLWTLSKFGRRWNLCVYMSLGGIACLCTAFFEKGVYPFNWPIVTLAMLGKFGINAAFGVIYIFSSETFPTVARNVGVGSSSVWARVGSIIAPYIDLLRHIHQALPLICYGVLSIIAGLLILLMPETRDQPIPETIEEAEKAGRSISRTPKKQGLPASSLLKKFLKVRSVS